VLVERSDQKANLINRVNRMQRKGRQCRVKEISAIARRMQKKRKKTQRFIHFRWLLPLIARAQSLALPSGALKPLSL
jgi:hypothetical protein